MHTNLNSAKGRSVNFIRTFWCHHFDQNTTNFLRISALASKGQLISKWFFGVFDFFKKTNENKSFWGIIVVKSNSFVRFLEETLAWKKSFRLCLTFRWWGFFRFVFHGIKRSTDELGKMRLQPRRCKQNFRHFWSIRWKKITFGTHKKWLQNTIDSSCMCTSTDCQEDGWVAKVKM